VGHTLRAIISWLPNRPTSKAQLACECYCENRLVSSSRQERSTLTDRSLGVYANRVALVRRSIQVIPLDSPSGRTLVDVVGEAIAEGGPQQREMTDAVRPTIAPVVTDFGDRFKPFA